MIYQENYDFKFFPYLATYQLNGESKKEFVIEKGRFERDLLERLQMEARFKAEEELRQKMDRERSFMPRSLIEVPEVKLPKISYQEITHTKDEISRLARCQKLNALISDIEHYVKTGKYPEGQHSLMYLELQDLKNAGISLGSELFRAQSEVLKTQEEHKLLAKQIFNLQTREVKEEEEEDDV